MPRTTRERHVTQDMTEGAGPVAMSTEEPPAATSERLHGSVWFAVTATLLSVLAPIALIRSTPLADDYSSAWVFALTLAVLVGMRFAWLVAVGAGHLFELIFWLFTYVFLGLAPMVQMRTSDYPDTTPFIDTGLNAAVMAVIAVGVVGFCVGLMAAGRARGSGKVRRIAVTSEHRLIILSTVALLFSAVYIARLGLGVLFESRLTRSLAESVIYPDSAVNAVVKALATLPLVVCFAGLLQLRRRRPEPGGFSTSVLPWVVLLVLAIVVNPVSSPRYFAGTALLAALTALGATATPNRARAFALTLALALVLVFPYAAVDRTPDSETFSDRGNPAVVLASADFDAFDQINNTLAFVRAEGTQNGRQLMGAVLFAVPRAVWSDKPQDTGPFLASYREYNFLNLSAPLWAEFYIDGSWLMVFVGMTALGYGVRRMDQRADATAASGRSALAVVLPFYLVLLLRGSLLQAMAGLSVLVVSGLFISRSLPAEGPSR
jgi:hypothetical protein